MMREPGTMRFSMTGRLIAIYGSIALVLLAACDSGQSLTPTPGAGPTATAGSNQLTPVDLVVTYDYRAGTMPPPYHNEYTVVVGPGTQGKVAYRPDYPSDATPNWTEVFTPTQAQLDELYTLIVKNDLLRSNWNEMDMPPVGGSVEWATIQANGQTYEIPSALDSGGTRDAGTLYTFVTDSLVPSSVWDSLEAQWAAWQKDFEDKQP